MLRLDPSGGAATAWRGTAGAGWRTPGTGGNLLRGSVWRRWAADPQGCQAVATGPGRAWAPRCAPLDPCRRDPCRWAARAMSLVARARTNHHPTPSPPPSPFPSPSASASASACASCGTRTALPHRSPRDRDPHPLSVSRVSAASPGSGPGHGWPMTTPRCGRPWTAACCSPLPFPFPCPLLPPWKRTASCSYSSPWWSSCRSRRRRDQKRQGRVSRGGTSPLAAETVWSGGQQSYDRSEQTPR